MFADVDFGTCVYRFTLGLGFYATATEDSKYICQSFYVIVPKERKTCTDFCKRSRDFQFLKFFNQCSVVRIIFAAECPLLCDEGASRGYRCSHWHSKHLIVKTLLNYSITYIDCPRYELVFVCVHV